MASATANMAEERTTRFSADPESTRRGLARTLGISLGGSGFGAAAAFIVAAIVGRLEGPDGAGIFYQFVAVFTIVVTLLKMGAETALVRVSAQLRALRRTAEIRDVLRFALPTVALLGAAVCTGLILMAPWLATLLVSDPAQYADVAWLVRVLAPLTVCSALFYLVLAVLRGTGSVGSFVGLLNVALPSARIVLVAVVLSAGATAATAVVAWAGTIPLWGTIAAVLVWRRVRRLSALDRQACAAIAVSGTGPVQEPMTGRRAFWGFSIGRWASSIVETTLDWVDVILVGAMLSPAAAGVYAVATRVVRAGQVVDNAMRVAVGPRISANMALGDAASVRKLFMDASMAMLVLTLPFYVTCLVFAEPILGLFGQEFQAGAPALRILAVGMIVSASTIMSQSIVLMAGRSHWQLRNKLVALSVVIAGNLILVPDIGIQGAAIAWALGISADAFLVSRQSRRIIHGPLSLGAVFGPLILVGGGVAALGLLVRFLAGDGTAPLFVHVGIIGLAYCAGVIVAVKVYGLRPRTMLSGR